MDPREIRQKSGLLSMFNANYLNLYDMRTEIGNRNDVLR